MRKTRIQRGVESLREQGTRNAAFYLFCTFLISYFVRFAKRMPVLGKLHIDFVLAGITLVAIAFAGRKASSHPAAQTQMDPVAKRLWILLAYIIVTIPFVEWPGSVLHNLESYAKSLCFFFFVVATVDTTRKLKMLLAVYVATQVWRVLEPLYMHLASGYWGDAASLGNWESMDRLSGSPYDIINSNGLGFVVIMTLPMLHFLIKPNTTVRRIVWAAIACAMCYALVLSASRSGFLALVFLCLFVIWRSKHRAAWLAVAVLGATLAVALMTGLQRERYVSIFSHSAKGGITAESRINGVIGDFKVSLRRPLFGHGLGTSQEANAHFRGHDQLSHDLYTETAEELGYVGLLLVLALIWSFLRACWTAQQVVSATATTDARLQFLHVVAVSLVVVVAVDLFFSFAAFGLSEPYWYFIGGLSVATARLAARLSPATANLAPGKRGGAGEIWKVRGRPHVRAPRRHAAPDAGTR
jgi:putative inorganic carbon (HCO3(-)) transporter